MASSLLGVLLVLTSIVSTVSAACIPNNQIADLYSGTTTFSLAPIANNTMAYTF
jgi:hypothetical protein